MSDSLIKARGISKHYVVGGSRLDVLSGVDLDITAGEIIAIIGESGAGKSTLLHILGMLDRPSSGTFSLNGDDITGKSDAELAYFRNSLTGFVFQFHHLLPEFSALENVMMPSLIGGKSKHESVDRAEYLLGAVGLTDRSHHRPGELSGGELQRVAVARALMNEPSIVFADEPSGNLDHRNSVMLHELLWKLAGDHNYTFIIVTHDIALAQNADKVLQLRDGAIQELDKKTFGELFHV
ncbi:ABC transporter ATP-binding protein [Candidatus Latescibacterota bacterium]